MNEAGRHVGECYWNAATVDAMGARYPGLDMRPWRAVLDRV